jgi:hypothetical protein
MMKFLKDTFSKELLMVFFCLFGTLCLLAFIIIICYFLVYVIHIRP